MDSSNTSGMNGTHLQQQYHGTPSFSFINDLESYTNEESMPGTDDFASFSWDPALFAGGEVGTSYSQQQQQPQQPQPPQQQLPPPPPQQQQQQQQQQQPVQANLNQTLTRQSHSPALQPLQPSHSPYPQSNYTHSLYDHRNMAQPSFDERFMSRPSASPTSFEHHQTYQQMPYGTYGYQQQYPRQGSPQNPYYAQRPVQQPQQMMNMSSHQPSQLSQQQQLENMQMHQYPNNQRLTHTFVNPSMINSSHMVAMNGPQQQNSTAPSARQQYQPLPYYQKPGSTVDPQALHTMQMQNYTPMGPTASHLIHQSSTPQPQPQPQQQQAQVQTPPISMQHTLPTKVAPQARPAKDPNAPKKSRAKSNKVKKDGTTGSESSDDLEIEDEPPEVKPALLVVSAPTDEKGRALYNAVEAVWYPRNRSPQAEDIRRGIAAFGETVRFLRDAWKAKNERLKKAEIPNSVLAAEAPQLKEDVAHYRQTMEGIMLRSLQYGHEAIIRRLGENQFTLSALYSFLLDRHNVSDFDSSLVNSIFKLAVKFESLDEEMLEQVKWTKVLQRIAKKATNDSKDYAQRILTNAQINSTRKKMAKSDGVPGSPSSANGVKKGTLAGVKRSREGDFAGIPVPKKIVKPASKPLALQSAERRKALEKEALQKVALAKTDKADKSAKNSSSAVTSRPKVTMTAPPKANVFAGLSVSKKPGTSIAERAAAAAAAVKEKPPVTSVAVPPVGPLAAAKKEEAKKESPPRSLGPGTAKTSSSFLGFLADMDKPKESETKKVDVDPNETEEQRTRRLRKEARKKLRVTWKPDNDLAQVKMFTHDPEEETGQTDNMMRDAGDTMKEGEMLKRHVAMEEMEDDEEEETSLEEFGKYTPPSEVDFSTLGEADLAGNFVKFGGLQNPESAASDSQTKYEEDTLMTTYTFHSDRPETPKELPSVNDDDDFQPVVDFGEPDEKTRSREREIISRRLPQQAAVLPAGGIDLAAQLRALGMQQPQPQPQPPASNPYSQSAVPAPVPPQMAGGSDLSKLFALVQQAQQMQQPTYSAPTSSIPPSVAAILAQVGGQPNPSLPLGNSGNPNPFPGNDDNRKHGRGEESSDPSSKKKKKGADGKPYNYKTIVCSFWLEGKCTKGDNCTYKHENT